MTFWAVLFVGVYYGDLNRWLAAALVALWAIGYFVLPNLATAGGFLVTPYVAVLDVALVLLVFKSDIRLM